MTRLLTTASVSALALAAAAILMPAKAMAATPVTGVTATSSITENIVFTVPVVTTNTIDTFSTEVIGKLQGGTVFDQTFAVPFTDPLAQAGVVSARQAITTLGGPGVLIAAPVRTQHTETVTSAATSAFTLNHTDHTVEIETVIGPNTQVVGGFLLGSTVLGPCAAAVAALPGAAIPVCGPDTRTTFIVLAETTNLNFHVNNTYFVDEARTQTDTHLTFEQWEIDGVVQATGVVLSAVQSDAFDSGSGFLERMDDQTGAGGWAQGHGLWTRRHAQRDLPGETGQALGLAGGVDFALDNDLTLGIAIDQSWSDSTVAKISEHSRLTLTQVGARLGYNSGSWTFDAGLAYGVGNVRETRGTVALGGVSSGTYGAQLWTASGQAGYGLHVGAWTLTPNAGLDWTQLSTGSFAETGSFALSGPAHDASRTRAWAGLDVATMLGPVTLEARARAVGVLSGRGRELPVTFISLPGTPLVVHGLAEPQLSAELGAGAGIALSSHARLSLDYAGRFSGGEQLHSLLLGVHVGW